ncbi:MAG: gliding motility-associated C-terminal domain-containing protein, partial [Flavipsychrobacter sp.]|nr:gliding motility-associated C-terminal domain-containing protein [Flavipsychrobacter sp.]
WGTKMYETNDINQGWDGNFNGKPQPIGVYVYTVEASTPKGKRLVKQGNVTLIR